MATKREYAPTWGERLDGVTRRVLRSLRHVAREFAYGVDTWSSITHGVEPSLQRRCDQGS